LEVKGSRRICAAAGLADRLAVGVAEVDAVEAGEAVDVAAALDVVDVAALAALDDRQAVPFHVGGHVGEVEHQMLPGERAQSAGHMPSLPCSQFH
jgi:hypothetical protein